MSHDEKRILSQEHEMMSKSVTTATLMERQASTMTTCETVISVEDSSSSPNATLRSSKVTTVTEEATIFDISSNTLSSHSITDEEEEEHQVDGTYSKSTIR